LVGNSLKHGFPDRHIGSIRVRLYRQGGTIQLHVEDEGVGLPPGFDVARATSMGP